MNNYLIPANSKRSQLIFSVFRPVDLGVLGVSAFITLILMFAIPGDTLSILFIKLLPIGIGCLLVVPIPFYHNVLVFLQEAYLYVVSQKRYIWRGWCASYGGFEEKDRSQSSKVR